MSNETQNPNRGGSGQQSQGGSDNDKSRQAGDSNKQKDQQSQGGSKPGGSQPGTSQPGGSQHGGSQQGGSGGDMNRDAGRKPGQGSQSGSGSKP
jgi:hypothetical protein